MTVLVVLLAATVVAETVYLSRLEKGVKRSGPVAVENETPTAAALAPSNAPQPEEQAIPFQDDLWANPYEAMQHMQQQMDRMFSNSFFHMGTMGMMPAQATGNETLVPPLDLTDQGTHYTVRLDLPGVEKPNIKVEVNDGQLTVAADRTQTQEEKDEKGHVIREERSEGEFLRSIPLPGPVKQDGMTANYNDGVLTINLPKVKPARVEAPHKVEVH